MQHRPFCSYKTCGIQLIENNNITIVNHQAVVPIDFDQKSQSINHYIMLQTEKGLNLHDFCKPHVNLENGGRGKYAGDAKKVGKKAETNTAF